MRAISVLLLGCVLSVPGAYAATDVYEWRDADGEEHMADNPPPAGQPGVVLLRINGKDVNTFDAGPIPKDSAPIMDSVPQAYRAAVPGDEASCREIHGRACDWDRDWRHYAMAECARGGDAQCHHKDYLKDHYDPRRYPGESVEAHGRRHRTHIAHRRR